MPETFDALGGAFAYIDRKERRKNTIKDSLRVAIGADPEDDVDDMENFLDLLTRATLRRLDEIDGEWVDP